MIKRFLDRDVRRVWFWLGVAAVVALRLAVSLCQRVFLTPEGAPLDDMLMLRAAVSLTEGDWLGPYTGVAIAKNMGFALWLALVHASGIPLLVANAALWLLCGGFATWALRPLFRGRLSALCLFAFLALQPFSYSQYTMRAYRDAIFPAFCLLVFAGGFGLCLFIQRQRLRSALLCALGCGVGLAGAWLLREDGIAVAIYAICAVALAALWVGRPVLARGRLFRRMAGKLPNPRPAKPLKGAEPQEGRSPEAWDGRSRALPRFLILAAPLLVLAAGVLAFSAANCAHYGVFMVNDLSSGAFPKAYGAAVAVSRAESGYTPLVPVSQKALKKLVREVPSLAALQAALAEGPVYNGYTNGEGEFGGSFYYALRAAAYNAGKTPDAATAQAFWAQMAQEIELAVAEGRLASVGARASVVPRWDMSLLEPTLAETGNGFLAVMTFAECWPQPGESLGDEGRIDEVAAWLNSSVQRGYVENTTQPYYNWFQQLMFAVALGLAWVYRVLIWPLAAMGVYGLWRRLRGGVRSSRRGRGFAPGLLLALALLGLALAFVLRLVVAAYMEVAAFDIGTFPMYLAGGVPALLVFCAAGVGLIPGWRAAVAEKQPAGKEAPRDETEKPSV